MKAIDIVNHYEIKIALLKSLSLSCSVGKIYDGTFSGKARTGVGITTAILMRYGVFIFNENKLIYANLYLKEIETRK